MKWSIIGVCSLVLVGLTGCDVDSDSSTSSQPRQRTPVAKFKQVQPVEETAMAVDVPLSQQRKINTFVEAGIAQAKAKGIDSPAQRERILNDAARRFGIDQETVEAIHSQMSPVETEPGKAGTGGVYEESVAADMRLAEQGDAAAQYRMGMRYLVGDGLAQDFVMAAQWLNRAAEQGHVEAAYRLGLCYKEGLGVNLDPLVAIHWWGYAAEQYHVAAQDELANAYLVGFGTRRDLVTAAMWSIIATTLEPDNPGYRMTRQAIANELTYIEQEEARERASMWLSSMPPGG
ncbi:MAG: tetratricopeptide repeat protein [Puniceicoccaceae bacterium]